MEMRNRFAQVALAALLTAAGGCLTPRDPAPWQKPTRFEQAQSLYLAKRFPEAKSLFDQLSVSSAPSEKVFRRESRYYSARCDQAMGRLESALEGYNEILASPTYVRLQVRVLASRAQVKSELADYQGAARDFAKARSRLAQAGFMEEADRIDYEMLLFGEGLARWNLRDYRRSDECFDEYMRRFPTGRFFQEARRHHTNTGGRAPDTKFYLLVGGNFSVRRNAETLLRQLAEKNIVGRIEERGGDVFVVRVGTFETDRDAYVARRQVEAAGFDPVEVRP